MKQVPLSLNMIVCVYNTSCDCLNSDMLIVHIILVFRLQISM